MSVFDSILHTLKRTANKVKIAAKEYTLVPIRDFHRGQTGFFQCKTKDLKKVIEYLTDLDEMTHGKGDYSSTSPFMKQLYKDAEENYGKDADLEDYVSEDLSLLAENTYNLISKLGEAIPSEKDFKGTEYDIYKKRFDGYWEF